MYETVLITERRAERPTDQQTDRDVVLRAYTKKKDIKANRKADLWHD